MRREKHQKPIAHIDGTVVREDMPLPFVHYPGHYGTFIGFSETQNGPVYLCSCALTAIQDCVRVRLTPEWHERYGQDRRFTISPHSFPSVLADAVKKLAAETSERCIKHLAFRDSICHQCLQKQPTYRWCHEMYGNPFVQNYGWYIEQRRFAIGMFHYSVDYIRCPREIRVLLEIDPNTLFRVRSELLAIDHRETTRLHKRFGRQQRQVARVIENQVRAQFGYKPVGHPSSGEAIIDSIVRRIFPDEPVYRCSRPPFLEGLELDVYLPHRRLAIEYQGEQHFQIVEHWGGADALAKLQVRDRRKQEICAKEGITLIHFDHHEELTEAFIKERIEKSVQR